jgi:hypothetical protein
LRQQSPGLFRKVLEDRDGLEERERRATLGRHQIEDSLKPGSGIAIMRVELITLADVDRLDRVREPGLLEEDRDLVPVGVIQ